MRFVSYAGFFVAAVAAPTPTQLDLETSARWMDMMRDMDPSRVQPFEAASETDVIAAYRVWREEIQCSMQRTSKAHHDTKIRENFCRLLEEFRNEDSDHCARWMLDSRRFFASWLKNVTIFTNWPGPHPRLDSVIVGHVIHAKLRRLSRENSRWEYPEGVDHMEIRKRFLKYTKEEEQEKKQRAAEQVPIATQNDGTQDEVLDGEESGRAEPGPRPIPVIHWDNHLMWSMRDNTLLISPTHPQKIIAQKWLDVMRDMDPPRFRSFEGADEGQIMTGYQDWNHHVLFSLCHLLATPEFNPKLHQTIRNTIQEVRAEHPNNCEKWLRNAQHWFGVWLDYTKESESASEREQQRDLQELRAEQAKLQREEQRNAKKEAKKQKYLEKKKLEADERAANKPTGPPAMSVEPVGDHLPPPPPPPASQFEKDNKVQISGLTKADDGKILNGKRGTVIEVLNNHQFRVRIDVPIKGTILKSGMKNNVFNLPLENIKLC